MIDTTPVNEQITKELKEEILTGRLRPGQKLSIEELANKWKVSSTPVRDAIHSLEASGFVHIYPRKSVVVATLDFKAFKDVFDLRIALECLAVELSIHRVPENILDDALATTQNALQAYIETSRVEHITNVDNIVHMIVLDYCDNYKLVSMMNDLHDLITWARSIVIQQPKAYDEAIYEHINILEHMKNRDVQAAVTAMRCHLANSYERSRSYWNAKENE